MKSVKQGRESHFMSAVVSGLAVIFGLGWTFFVMSSGGGAFGLFGLVFVLIGILNVIRGLRGAFSKNRPSEYDIMDSDEEPDPWNERFGNRYQTTDFSANDTYGKNEFCPFCGAAVGDNFEFCNKCGKKLP